MPPRRNPADNPAGNPAPTAAEQASIASLPGLPGLQLLRASFTTRCFPRHSHEGFGVGVIEQGALGFQYRGEHLVAPPGRINTVNPDEVHTGQAATSAGWTYRMFYLSPQFLARMDEDISGQTRPLPFFNAGVIDDPGLAALLRHTHLRCCEPGAERLETDALLLRLFAGLLARHSYEPLPTDTPGPEHAAVARAKDCLHSRHAEPLDLDTVARAACLSPYHFIRVFARHTGLTPHAWLMQLRARKAAELLRRGLPLADAAQQTGFADQSHLSKVFKRLHGISPGQFRNSVQGAQARTG